MNEIWKPIKGYEGYYEISNLGRVKSLCRKIPNTRGRQFYYRLIKETILKKTTDNDGYHIVSLYKDNKTKNFKVHQLVANAFCENPNGYKQIDHINTIRTDNRADNLIWCTSKENHNNKITLLNHKKATIKKAKANLKDGVYKLTTKVIQYDLAMNKIREFNSIKDAASSVGVSSNAITRVCKHIQKQSAGYIWRYKS